MFLSYEYVFLVCSYMHLGEGSPRGLISCAAVKDIHLMVYLNQCSGQSVDVHSRAAHVLLTV